MNLLTYDQSTGLNGKTHSLMKKMVSPLCGLNKSISFLLRGRNGPKFFVAGGDLTGVHVLQGRPEPPKGFYHIGGCGIERQESMIRTLGETIERYTQFVSEIKSYNQIVFDSYDNMILKYSNVLDPNTFVYFEDSQFTEAGFPFSSFKSSEGIGWIKVEEIRGIETWVPAQLFLVGYTLKEGERWIQAAVTTGSAAHVTIEKASINAIMELIQLDTSMGHWFSNGIAQKIELDDRTSAVQRIIDKQFVPGGPKPNFYWMKSPDLPGFTVVCILKQENGTPKISLGQSCELKLNDAMYKALLEAVGVYHLARLKIFEKGIQTDNKLGDPGMIKDLDTNVAYYGLKGETDIINKKFPSSNPIKASDMPKDKDDDFGLEEILQCFTNSGKQLFQMNTTTPDVNTLGFYSWRYWSPDTLSLCLPGTPNKAHKRFKDFGGFANPNPHPYP